MDSLSVIVPAFDAAKTIGATLAALAAQDVSVSYEVIVVDDGSTDGTAEIVRQAGDPVRLIQQSKSGPAAARNRGVEASSGRWLAFTDSDCVPAPDWLAKGFAALGRADLVQGKVIPDPSVDPRPFDRTISVSREHGLYETANLLATRDVFDRVGGFIDWLPAKIGKPLAEDVWFAWRVRRTGARVVFSEETVVVHAVFRRNPSAYIGERARLQYFPAMVAQVPELRDAFLHRRLFLTPRTLVFDLALASAAIGITGRRYPAVRVAGLLGTAPYARKLLGDGVRWPRRFPIVIPAYFLADALSCAALVAGSIRRRTLVL